MNAIRSRRGLLPLVLTVTVFLGACGSSEPGEQGANGGPESSAAAPAGMTSAASKSGAADAAEAPQRIVAVTSDVAGIVLSLTGGDRVVAVPASLKSAPGPVAQAASAVEATLPPGTDPEVEQVLALQPDLVIATTRHGGEKSLADQLATTGVRSLVIDPDDFTTPEGVATVTRAIGAAVGMQAVAEEKAAQFEKDIARQQARAEGVGKHPRALALMSRGPQVMAMDDSLMLPGLIGRAGADYAAARIGVTNTRPIDAEQLLAANPDVLFLEDFQGQGRAPFEELLKNPAVAEVPAIKNNQVHVIAQSDASGISGLNTAIGFGQIIDVIEQS